MPARWVQALLEVQATDLRIRDLETRMSLLPGELTKLKEKRDKVAAGTAAAADAARKIERAIKANESEIARLTEESKKLQQQSAMVKKNIEYQAMLNTIALNKNKIGDLEGKVLELMDQFEAAKVNYRKVKTANDATIQTIRGEFEELVAFAGEVKEEIKKLRESRPGMIRFVDNDTLGRYNALLGGKNGGTPLVKVENGICGSCHLRVSPQVMNDISKGAVTYCANCQHLLYDDEAQPE